MDVKTLANCDEVEFLRQTNKIRKAVQKWLTVTDIMNIRKNLPEYKKAPKDATKEERERINEENKALEREQAKANIDKMLDSMLEEHPEETLEILKLCCFVEPGDKTSHHITYYMTAFTEMLNDEAVISFFQSLAHLARKFGLTV